MSMTANIKTHIFRLPERTLFTSRDLLIYGTRASVDQTIYLLVKKAEILRLARGVFMRMPRDGWRPSVEQIVSAKAKAFHRIIALHPAEAAKRLGLSTRRDAELLFACSGRTSTFKVGSLTIRTHQTSPRLISLPDNTASMVIRGLSGIQKERLTSDIVNKAIFAIITRDDRSSFRSLSAHLPHRISSRIPGYRRKVPPKFKFQPDPYEDYSNSGIA